MSQSHKPFCEADEYETRCSVGREQKHLSGTTESWVLVTVHSSQQTRLIWSLLPYCLDYHVQMRDLYHQRRRKRTRLQRFRWVRTDRILTSDRTKIEQGHFTLSHEDSWWRDMRNSCGLQRKIQGKLQLQRSGIDVFFLICCVLDCPKEGQSSHILSIIKGVARGF